MVDTPAEATEEIPAEATEEIPEEDTEEIPEEGMEEILEEDTVAIQVGAMEVEVDMADEAVDTAVLVAAIADTMAAEGAAVMLVKPLRSTLRPSLITKNYQ